MKSNDRPPTSLWLALECLDREWTCNKDNGVCEDSSQQYPNDKGESSRRKEEELCRFLAEVIPTLRGCLSDLERSYLKDEGNRARRLNPHVDSNLETTLEAVSCLSETNRDVLSPRSSPHEKQKKHVNLCSVLQETVDYCDYFLGGPLFSPEHDVKAGLCHILLNTRTTIRLVWLLCIARGHLASMCTASGASHSSPRPAKTDLNYPLKQRRTIETLASHLISKLSRCVKHFLSENATKPFFTSTSKIFVAKYVVLQLLRNVDGPLISSSSEVHPTQYATRNITPPAAFLLSSLWRGLERMLRELQILSNINTNVSNSTSAGETFKKVTTVSRVDATETARGVQNFVIPDDHDLITTPTDCHASHPTAPPVTLQNDAHFTAEVTSRLTHYLRDGEQAIARTITATTTNMPSRKRRAALGLVDTAENIVEKHCSIPECGVTSRRRLYRAKVLIFLLSRTSTIVPSLSACFLNKYHSSADMEEGDNLRDGNVHGDHVHSDRFSPSRDLKLTRGKKRRREEQKSFMKSSWRTTCSRKAEFGVDMVDYLVAYRALERLVFTLVRLRGVALRALVSNDSDSNETVTNVPTDHKSQEEKKDKRELTDVLVNLCGRIDNCIDQIMNVEIGRSRSIFTSHLSRLGSPAIKRHGVAPSRAVGRQGNTGSGRFHIKILESILRAIRGESKRFRTRDIGHQNANDSQYDSSHDVVANKRRDAHNNCEEDLVNLSLGMLLLLPSFVSQVFAFVKRDFWSSGKEKITALSKKSAKTNKKTKKRQRQKSGSNFFFAQEFETHEKRTDQLASVYSPMLENLCSTVLWDVLPMCHKILVASGPNCDYRSRVERGENCRSFIEAKLLQSAVDSLTLCLKCVVYISRFADPDNIFMPVLGMICKWLWPINRKRQFFSRECPMRVNCDEEANSLLTAAVLHPLCLEVVKGTILSFVAALWNRDTSSRTPDTCNQRKSNEIAASKRRRIATKKLEIKKKGFARSAALHIIYGLSCVAFDSRTNARHASTLISTLRRIANTPAMGLACTDNQRRASTMGEESNAIRRCIWRAFLCVRIGVTYAAGEDAAITCGDCSDSQTKIPAISPDAVRLLEDMPPVWIWSEQFLSKALRTFCSNVCAAESEETQRITQSDFIVMLSLLRATLRSLCEVAMEAGKKKSTRGMKDSVGIPNHDYVKSIEDSFQQITGVDLLGFSEIIFNFLFHQRGQSSLSLKSKPSSPRKSFHMLDDVSTHHLEMHCIRFFEALFSCYRVQLPLTLLEIMCKYLDSVSSIVVGQDSQKETDDSTASNRARKAQADISVHPLLHLSCTFTEVLSMLTNLGKASCPGPDLYCKKMGIALFFRRIQTVRCWPIVAEGTTVLKTIDKLFAQEITTSTCRLKNVVHHSDDGGTPLEEKDWKVLPSIESLELQLWTLEKPDRLLLEHVISLSPGDIIHAIKKAQDSPQALIILPSSSGFSSLENLQEILKFPITRRAFRVEGTPGGKKSSLYLVPA